MPTNSFFTANLVSLRKITVSIFSSLPTSNEMKFYFASDVRKPMPLAIKRHVSTNQISLFDFELPFDFPFRERCYIVTETFGRIAINVNNAPTFPEFDEMFNYDGSDLGATYSKEKTSFAIWAPISTSCFLKLENEKGVFEFISMNGEERGVFRVTVEGDLLNRRYHYVVLNSGVPVEVNDPYGKGVSLNSEWSAVVDTKAIKNMKKIAPKTKIKNYSDAIIYEGHIRDLTEDKNTNIKNKGKYLGLCEENAKTSGGHPAGLAYLEYLGITHLQLQPILDFRGNDIPDIHKEYNWGYDPISMFALEGSFSTKPNIPQARLEEFRTLVDTLHQHNIRVNVDVVFNHVADYLLDSFNSIVPNYFFRRKSNGALSASSGCGNDYASERYMASKAIVDSCKYLLETFDIDGLRFDLMGLIDIKTMNKVASTCQAIKKDFMVYGEGWNMGYELPFEQKACSENSYKMPHVAFFNDSFRDITKGHTFDLATKGFINGDPTYQLGFEYAFMGSCVDYCFKPRYISSNQSLNYVECHDNHTIYDKLTHSNDDEDEESILDRVNLASGACLFSFGVPFIHMGQEIGQSKCDLGNTYNTPKVNNMDYALLDKRWDMTTYFKGLISLRNNELSFLKEVNDPREISQYFNFEDIDTGAIKISLKEDSPLKEKYQDLVIFMNVSNETVTYDLDEYYQLIFTYGGLVDKTNPIFIQEAAIPPRCLQVLILKKES